jgi:hypothetical protein
MRRKTFSRDMSAPPVACSEAPKRQRPVGGQRFCRADYQRRERQRQMKNDEARPSPEAAREEFFPGV